MNPSKKKMRGDSTDLETHSDSAPPTAELISQFVPVCAHTSLYTVMYNGKCIQCQEIQA